MKKQVHRHIKALKRMTLLSRIILLVLLLLVGAFFARGWIRHSALAWYGNRIAAPDVSRVYDDSFGTFNQQLKADGVVFGTALREHLPCSTTNYHHFQVTVRCQESNVTYADPSVPDRAVADWPNLYHALSTHMAGGKARLSTESNVAPSDLFAYVDRPRGVPGNNLKLVGRVGKVSCSAILFVNPAHTETMQAFSAPPRSKSYTTQLLMTESCGRDINIFGGWSCDYYNDCKRSS